MISYILYRTASFLAGSLPPALCTRIATVIAFLFYAARPEIRRNVRTNFDRIGTHPSNTFAVFRNFSRAVTDLLRLSHLSRAELMARCRVRGIENLEAALKRGRGAILFAPHLGSWELAGAYMSCLGFRMNTVALEHPSERVTMYLSGMRNAWGVKDYSSRSCGPALMRALVRGESVVLLVDRSFSRRGSSLRFFGADVLLPDGHVTLSLRSGAPLLPCCSCYTPEGAVEIVVGEEVRVPDAPASRAAIGRACIERIEEFVRAHPDEWFAFDHLWKGEGRA
jgi:lauroyl/myristoyl acyltransferase